MKKCIALGMVVLAAAAMSAADGAKPEATKPAAEAKPAEAKPAEAAVKPAEAKPAEAAERPAEAGAAEAVAAPAAAGGAAEAEGLVETGDGGRRPWRVSVGAAMNAGVKTRLSHRAVPLPDAYVRSLPGMAEATASATSGDFGDGYYVHPQAGLSDTADWRLPGSALNGGSFEMRNEFEDVTASSLARRDSGNPGDDYEPGVSVELSREVWSDPDRGWGVDVAVAASYFFGDNLYSARGGYVRNETTVRGTVTTTVNAQDALAEYSGGDFTPNADGSYGHATTDSTMPHPRISTVAGADGVSVGAPTTEPGVSRVNRSSYSANGDYEELELMLLARPWYDVTDWWRVFAEGGVAVGWSRFDFAYSAMGAGGSVRAGEDFSQWRCYGVAGLGTAFRFGDVDVSVDVLGRFLNDDLDCDSRYCSGKIEHADWLLRVMVGFSF